MVERVFMLIQMRLLYCAVQTWMFFTYILIEKSLRSEYIFTRDICINSSVYLNNVAHVLQRFFSSSEPDSENVMKKVSD
jgi:hypothetical protein